jgi:RNA polymerase primary sigma factor
MAVIDTLEAYWQDIANIPQLSEQEESKLAERIKAGDERAVEKLVTANLRFVVAMARQLSEKGEVSMSDLISEGNMAMLLAAKKWEPEKEPHFVRYASYGVRKAMMAAIPQQGPMVTMPKNGMTDQRQMKRFSTDAPVHPGQTNTLGDMLKAGKPMTDDGAEISETNYAITLAFDQLNERERQIMTHFYGIGTTDQMTMAEIGERMNLKRERVRQIRKTAERKMRRIMKKQ